MPNGTGWLTKPRVYIDTDVLIAACASRGGASHIIVKLAELTLVTGLISEAVRLEAERNLLKKLPQALPAYRALVRAAKLHEVPLPSASELAHYRGQGDPKDLVHLVAACKADCAFLVTHNTRHYSPASGSPEVLTPGELVHRIRAQFASLGR